ncbi:MAG: M23 family metallopeptidase, partial [Proteobacteria bacterium]|nr:M23 family metallopeptidase [Pseudomonadota bacterium]
MFDDVAHGLFHPITVPTCLPRSHGAEAALPPGFVPLDRRRPASPPGRHGQKRWRLLGPRALLAALLAPVPVVALAADPPRLVPPVAAACVSSPFGPRAMAGRAKAGTFHPGIDLPAALGAPVLAVAPGAIMKVQRRGPGGLEMLVQHAGFVGVYSHLGLIAPVILTGRRTVGAGEKLGTVGRSGLTYGPHLYFGILVNGKPVDPAPLLGLPRCSGTEPARGV